MRKARRLVIPLPFVDVRITLRGSRRRGAMLWYLLLSAAMHVVVAGSLAVLIVHAMFPAALPKHDPVITVALSTALRIEQRPRPVRAHNVPAHPQRAVAKPQTATPAQTQPRVQPHVQARPQQVAFVHRHSVDRPRELTRPVAAAHPQLDADELQREAAAFNRTIAQARAASDPVAGAADSTEAPSAPRRYAMNLNGDPAKPQPEGILYPLKRWVDGPYVYYYVRYVAQYADGSSEEGIVPWPIRFPLADDPFARDMHRMALPGPMAGYVADPNVEMHPLVKNCYDHRYEYCPIARGAY